MNLKHELEKIVREKAPTDAAHDLEHCRRVYINCLKLSTREGGDPAVLMAASYLHDIANLPKSHPDSHMSSERSAEEAVRIMREMDMAETKLACLHDAVLCHSYSRGLTPQTLEGRIFQDADRLDALGAVGIARTFAVTGAMGRSLYHSEDPFHKSDRNLDDRQFAVDHFYRKLFALHSTMQTPTGRKIAELWTERQKTFLSWLRDEIESANTAS